MRTKTLEMALEIIRGDVVLPFIAISEDAKALGMKADLENETFSETVENKHEVFPNGLTRGGTELMSGFDSTLMALFRFAEALKCKEVRVLKDLVEYERQTGGNAVAIFANFRVDCSTYLYEIAKDPQLAAERFERDENPWILYSAILAISTLVHKCIPESVDTCLKYIMCYAIKAAA